MSNILRDRNRYPTTYEYRKAMLIELCGGKRINEVAHDLGRPPGSVTKDLHLLRKQEGVRNNIQLAARIVFNMRP